jgi:hypothetical protein
MDQSEGEALREREPVSDAAARLAALERRLDEAVGVLLVGTDWLVNGAVWTVEAALYGELRVSNGATVVICSVREWLAQTDAKRLPCRRAK